MADNQLARDGRTEFDLFPDDDPLSELARIVGYDNRPAMQQLQELERHRNAVRQDPDLGLEDELLREFESYGSRGGDAVVEAVQPVAEEPALQPVDVEASSYDSAEPDDGWNLAVEASADHVSATYAEAEQSLAEPAFEEPVFEEAAFGDLDLDLERELELSIGYANEAPSVASVAADEVSDDISADVSFALANEPVAHEAPADAVYSEPAAEISFEPIAKQEQVASGVDLVDELLADIERFPVPVKASVVSTAPPVAVRKNTYPFTPMFSRATPVVSDSGAGQKAYAAPIVAAAPAVVTMPSVVAPQPVPEPVFAAEATYVEENIVAEPVVVAGAEALTADPDFDLDAFELDLSDIDLDIDPAELQALERAEVAAAAVAQPVAIAKPEPVVAPEPVSFARQPLPVEPSSYAVPEPIVETEYVSEEQNDSELPFDPAMIAEAEESLTAIAELDVPHLPVAEPEKPIVYQPDYELDIDAEMAQLFGAPGRSARNVEHGHNEHPFANVAPSAPVVPIAAARSRAEDDFDAFEKAMEEDFRQSLNPHQSADNSNDRLAVGSGYVADDYVEERRSSGVRRIALLAATVAGIAILGGAGVYAWMGGSAPGLSGGDPKVILADKTPVKIVPVEKGGKAVPNQDKAVYDRVAGAQAQEPQQGALVSSTEEPVDVVQRTLTPEELPLEGRADEALPGVSSSEDDDRLMPETELAADKSAATEDSTPAVSPRKVRTMIVKPDGTLVAREDVAPAAETQQVVASAEPVVTPVKTSKITQDAPATATEAQPQRSALAEAADVKVEETAPVRPVSTTAVKETAAVTETAALPQARPETEQPVVEQTASTPKVETPAPVQTATVAPGGYVVQIASLPSEAEAQKSYNSLSGKFGSVIGGRGVDIKKAEIAGKGTYYRVRIPAGSKDDANSLCARYKSAGGSCLVTR